MRWLVDCDDVAVPVASSTSEVVAGSAITAPQVEVRDNGEDLVAVREHLPVWWVYSS